MYCLLSYFSSSMNLARIVCLCFRTFFSKKHPRITLITLVCPMPKKQHFRIFRSGIFPARLFSLVMFCPILTIFYLFVVKVRRDLSTVGACVVSIPWGVLALLRYFCSILRYFLPYLHTILLYFTLLVVNALFARHTGLTPLCRFFVCFCPFSLFFTVFVAFLLYVAMLLLKCGCMRLYMIR